MWIKESVLLSQTEIKPEEMEGEEEEESDGSESGSDDVSCLSS